MSEKDDNRSDKNIGVMLDIARIYENAMDEIFRTYFAVQDSVQYCMECKEIKKHYIVRNEIVCEECGCRSEINVKT